MKNKVLFIKKFGANEINLIFNNLSYLNIYNELLL